MPTDIKLDRRTHDVDLSSGTIELFTSNPRAVAQRVKVAILRRRREWFRDINSGVPYYTEFFQRKNNKNFIDQFMINYISKIEGVQEVVQYNSSLDASTRTLNITFTIKTIDGDIEEIRLGV